MHLHLVPMGIKAHQAWSAINFCGMSIVWCPGCNSQLIEALDKINISVFGKICNALYKVLTLDIIWSILPEVSATAITASSYNIDEFLEK